MCDEPRKNVKSREASSQVFVLESSDLNSTVAPTAVELGSDSSMEQSCSVASTATQEYVDNSFWTQPFVVETYSYDHAYGFRECDGAGDVFSPLFGTWLDDVNHMHCPF